MSSNGATGTVVGSGGAAGDGGAAMAIGVEAG